MSFCLGILIGGFFGVLLMACNKSALQHRFMKGNEWE